jgi:hypothetical protein
MGSFREYALNYDDQAQSCLAGFVLSLACSLSLAICFEAISFLISTSFQEDTAIKEHPTSYFLRVKSRH